MNKKLFEVYLVLLIILSTPLYAKSPIKVACIGNSITFGTGTENPQTESYPAQLQQLLGHNYIVGNFGKPGATLLKRGPPLHTTAGISESHELCR
mgnify:CR=1 FL=1